MRTIDATDIERMTGELYIDRSLSSPSSTRYWGLLVLSGVIASAGVIADSTATVIGAMIVAPMMTPILGSVLAIVLAQRRRLLHSVLLVVAGALVVVLIGFVVGSVMSPADGFAGNAQIDSRISPRLVDLLAALATGTVGAFALVRSDIADTLPGVAIAISLVPPLAATGLLLQVHRYHDAAQAALLFGTNVTAMIVTGTIVFLIYRVRAAATSAGVTVGRLRGSTLVVVLGLIVVVAVPLTAGTMQVAREENLVANARPLAAQWAKAEDWRIVAVAAREDVVTVTALGMPPELDPLDLRRALDAHGLHETELRIQLVGGHTRSCPPRVDSCTVLAGD